MFGNMKKHTELALMILCLALTAYCYPQEDEIVSLPGLPTKPSWKQYSGYLNGTGNKHLHYWFIQSARSTAKSDPVVLWMNGGPGCSSDLGLLSEHGPFRVNLDGKTLTYNPNSWNLVANMLYLEAPAGVGYSYSDDKQYATDDDQVSLDNFMAVKHFFEKFPELKANDFFVTGESYGGIYVPTLSSRIVDDPSINFKGFVVGNGLSDAGMNANSLIYFAYFHGLIGEELWASLGTCCGGNLTRCSFISNPKKSPTCGPAISRAQNIVYGDNLNVYNLYEKCVGNSGIWYDAERKKVTYSLFPWQHYGNSEVQRKLKYIQAFTDKENHLRLTPACLNYDYVIKYMNLAEVRTALHIPSQVQAWDVCSAAVGGMYKTLYNTMKDQYMKVLQKNKRIMVYNGDVDMACNFLGDEWFTDSLNLKIKEARKSWKVDDAQLKGQVLGFVKLFENLIFITIKGAGHMVPTDKPEAALKMFSNFVENKPF